MSISVSIISLDPEVPAADYEELTNRLVAYGEADEICRLFQFLGMLSRLLTEGGGEKMPYSFLQNESNSIPGTSDPTWLVTSDQVAELWNGIAGWDAARLFGIVEPWSDAFKDEVLRRKRVGASVYADMDPDRLWSNEVAKLERLFLRFKTFVRLCAERGHGFLVCKYEDW